MESPSEIIFNRRWIVRVPTLATFSDEELEIRGIGISMTDGTKDLDSYKDMITCGLTIAELAEIHSNGNPIYCVEPEDAGKIYKVIDEHISNWKIAMTRSVNKRKYPESDLRKLDAFAHEIFGLNKSKLVKDILGESRGFGTVNQMIMSKNIKQAAKQDVDTVVRTSQVVSENGSSKYSLEDLLK